MGAIPVITDTLGVVGSTVLEHSKQSDISTLFNNISRTACSPIFPNPLEHRGLYFNQGRNKRGGAGCLLTLVSKRESVSSCFRKVSLALSYVEKVSGILV